MKKYLVRISPSYSYIKDNMESIGRYFKDLVNQIGSKQCELIIERFTFGLYYVKANSKIECENLIRNAWEELHPDSPELSQFYCVQYIDDEDTSYLMRQIYGGLYGVDGYLKLTTELYSTIPSLIEKQAIRALHMQNYLFAVDKGYGFTTLISSFANYLSRMGVYKTSSQERTQYIEFTIHSETEGERTSATDFINYLNENLDKNIDGIVGVDISYFLEENKTEDLRRFIRRLYPYQKDYVFAFRIPFIEKKALSNIEQILSDLMLLKVVEIPPIDDCFLLEHAWDCISNYNYYCDTSMIQPFYAKIHKEKSDGRFWGFKTVEKIVQDTIIQKAYKTSISTQTMGEKRNDTIYSEDIDITYNQNEKNGYELLSELIGMDKIIERVKEIVSQVKVAIKNEKLDRPCIHMRFHGAPGTGKTTVARILGQIFREEGILRKGGFLEYSARSLCAEYVGQTAVKTAAICRDAYGSVLFLDEAYALYTEDSKNDYGKEALTTLISEMENHRDDMLVIMAGYTDDMETLMKGNAGLRSRMPYIIDFKNYTREQLFEIFMLMVRKHFDYTKELEDEAKKFFLALTDKYLASKEFANARFVRNLYERTWSKAALRTSLSGNNNISLTREDFIAASNESEFAEKIEVKKIIGF